MQPNENLRKTRGLTAAVSKEFLNALDEAFCTRVIVDALHPQRILCPQCEGVIDDASRMTLFMQGREITCAGGHRFTARSKTFLSGSQMTYSQIFLLTILINLMKTGLGVQQVANMISVSPDTIRLWMRKFDFFEGVDFD